MFEKSPVKNEKQIGIISKLVFVARFFVTLIFVALFLTGCQRTPFPLDQTNDERAIAAYHRSSDTRTWRYPEAVDIGIAQKEARKRWPEFVEAFEKRKNPTAGEKQFVFYEVKIPVGVAFATEHMWMRVIAITPKSVTGNLDATATYLKFYNEGREFVTPIHDVEDWVYGDEVTPVGAFTLMPLRKAKLYELLNLTMVDGKLSDSSVQTSLQEIHQLAKIFSQSTPEDLVKFMAKEMDPKDSRLCWWNPCLALLADAERAINSTSHKNCTDEELSVQCGLPVSIVKELKKTNAIFLDKMQNLGRTP